MAAAIKEEEDKKKKQQNEGEMADMQTSQYKANEMQ